MVGSVLTHLVGRPLIGLNFQQQRFEADFRFGLVRLRENAEGVALYHGEGAEQADLLGRFERIRANWWAADALHQAPDLLHRRLRPDRDHLPDPGRGAALLLGRDHAWAC